MRGAPAVSIKELAGHSSITVTNRYMHETGELRSAIDRFDYGQATDRSEL